MALAEVLSILFYFYFSSLVFLFVRESTLLATAQSPKIIKMKG